MDLFCCPEFWIRFVGLLSLPALLGGHTKSTLVHFAPWPERRGTINYGLVGKKFLLSMIFSVSSTRRDGVLLRSLWDCPDQSLGGWLIRLTTYSGAQNKISIGDKMRRNESLDPFCGPEEKKKSDRVTVISHLSICYLVDCGWGGFGGGSKQSSRMSTHR